MSHEGYFNKIIQYPCSIIQILFETIITCKNNHMQENEKRNQNKKKGKKTMLNNVIINMRYV